MGFLSVLFSFLIFKNNESDKKKFPPPPPSWLYSGRYFAFFQISRNAKKIIKTKILPHNSIVLLLLLWNDMVYICLTVAFFFLFICKLYSVSLHIVSSIKWQKTALFQE